MSLASRLSAVVVRIAQEIRTIHEDTWTYRASLGQVAAGATVQHTIEFPPGRFSSSPMIVASVGGTSSGASNISIIARTWNASGCTVSVTNNGSASVVWITVVARRA